MALDTMTTIDKRVGAAILAMMRKRSVLSPGRLAGMASPSAAVAPAKIREVQFSDFEAVRDLKHRWGWDRDSIENWNHLWRHNPALSRFKTAPCMGWVLEAGGRIVGYLGNVALVYHYEGRLLPAAAGSGFVVEPAYRAMGISLISAYYRQKCVELFLTTSAIESVGRIARTFRAMPLPQEEYETVLFWVLRAFPFAQAVMKKLEVKPGISQATGTLMSIAVGSDKLFRRRWPKPTATTPTVQEISLNEIGDEFHRFWLRQLAERHQLLADRSVDNLKWHLSVPGQESIPGVFCCYLDGALSGYLAIRPTTDPSTGLRRGVIVDLFTGHEDTESMRALLLAGYEYSKKAGCHVLELLGFPQEVRKLCREWQPYERKYQSCPFYYKAADPALQAALSQCAAWYATPFDGDTTLTP